MMPSKVWAVLVAAGACALPAAATADEKPRFGPKWEYRVLTKSEVLALGKNDLAAGLDKLGADGWELAAVEGQYIFKRLKGPDRRRAEELKRIVAVAEADADAWKDRVTWAERMVKKGYLTEGQLQSERAQLRLAELYLDAARQELQDLRPDPKPPAPKEPRPEK